MDRCPRPLAGFCSSVRLWLKLREPHGPKGQGFHEPASGGCKTSGPLILRLEKKTEENEAVHEKGNGEAIPSMTKLGQPREQLRGWLDEAGPSGHVPLIRRLEAIQKKRRRSSVLKQ